jgi:hypothetical protein
VLPNEPTRLSLATGLVGMTLVLMFLSNTFAIYFLSQERFVYYWDWSAYWITYIDISTSLVEHPIAAVRSLIHSIRTDDYNLSPVLTLIPFELLFGPGRLTYILAITNVYLLPSAILMGLLAQRVLLPCSRKWALFSLVTAATSILILHPLWVPVLRGRPDVAGVAVIGGILLLHFTKPFLEQRLHNLIATGFLLCILVLLRRWYLFWAVAFFPALAVAQATDIYQRHGVAWRHYFSAARNAIIIGLTFILALFGLATPFAVRAVSTDYSDIYSAYRFSNSLVEAAGRLLSYLGLTVTIASLLGLVWLTLRKQTRVVGIFLTAQSLIVFVAFARTQDFGTHHCYLLVPTIAVAVAAVAIGLYAQIANRLRRAAAIGFFFAVLLATFSAVLAPRAASLSEVLGRFVPVERMYPLVRNDIDVLDRLLDRLGNLNIQEPGDIYVLASSGILNSSILQNRCRLGPQGRFFCDRILVTHDVDKRDGFPRQFLRASYLVVASPTQYHLRADDQRVIGILAREVMEANGIGASFQRLPEEFSLDRGVTAWIFEKSQPFKRADLDALSGEFARYYPDERSIFLIQDE